MIVDGQHFIIPRHLLQGRNHRPRSFFNRGDFPKQREIGAKFAEERGEDFLICLVSHEVIVKTEVENVVGKYILINKHRKAKNSHIPVRRNFFSEEFIDGQKDLAAQYASEISDNYLICKVIEEISASSKAKRAARKARENAR